MSPQWGSLSWFLNSLLKVDEHAYEPQEQGCLMLAHTHIRSCRCSRIALRPVSLASFWRRTCTDFPNRRNKEQHTHSANVYARSRNRLQSCQGVAKGMITSCNHKQLNNQGDLAKHHKLSLAKTRYPYSSGPQPSSEGAVE